MVAGHYLPTEASITLLDPKAIRKTILDAAYRSKNGHLPSCLSVVEILAALYGGILRFDPKNPKWPERDYFILSKGHAAGGFYSVLAHAGFFSPEFYVETYTTLNSSFGCHPDRNKVPGVEASTGSLGHGFPFGIGIAAGLRMRGKTNNVYILIGDGESNEGSIWESSMIAAHQSLDNVIGVLDFNNSQTRCLPLTEPSRKWESFGWNVEDADGHSVPGLQKAFSAAAGRKNGKPSMIVAHTQKGKGLRYPESEPFVWHHRAPTKEEYEKMVGELS